MQSRYELPVPVLDRGRTLAGFAAADAVTRMKRCVGEADAANACYLAADLLASGHGARLVDGLVDMVADPRYLVPAFALGVADDVADLALLCASSTSRVANDPSARHLAVQAVVRMCLLSKPGRNGKKGGDDRAATLVRAHGAKLSVLEAEVVPLLRQAPVQGDMVAKVTSALELLRTQEGEARRVRVVSLVARAAPAAIPSLITLAENGGGPHARVALTLARSRRVKSPSLLLAAFAGPSPLDAVPWTRAERSNVMYAILRAHVLFESVAEGMVSPTQAPASAGTQGTQGTQDQLLDRVRRDARVDPDVAHGVDAMFRRKARLDALFRV